tara:strand:+ start:110 stop:715 length:606 start_codon:yes stop_codon:yes gene_type:complete
MFAASVMAQPDIQVQGLFAGKAVLNINGSLRMLSEGEISPEGILLVSANTRLAVIEHEEQRYELDLTSRINSDFVPAENKEVRLMADNAGHYFTTVRINGRQATAMLDTGATSIAINSRQAQSLGLNYQDAPSHVVSTASGRVQARQITLNRVSLGEIELNAVAAVVLEGDFPEVILLGNSFLSRIEMNNQGSVMVLTAPF